jgi:hypothetical protein
MKFECTVVAVLITIVVLVILAVAVPVNTRHEAGAITGLHYYPARGSSVELFEVTVILDNGHFTTTFNTDMVTFNELRFGRRIGLECRYNLLGTCTGCSIAKETPRQ